MKMKTDLNGKWQMRQLDKDKYYNANVPGCNYLDLMDSHIIVDPFVGVNEKDSLWVGQCDFEYSRQFDVTDDMMSFDSVSLVCCCLDTICDVIINDKLVFKGKNAHIKYNIDVKKYLSIGENRIKIIFYSPVNYVKDMYKKESTPMNSNGQNGIVHIRKPQCHFGWDWGPVLPLSGITDDIYILCENTAKIESFSVFQKHYDDRVTLTFDAEIKNLDEKEHSLTYRIEITEPDGNLISKSCDDIKSITVDIEKPQLWWTFEQSGVDEQPLYNVKLIAFTDSDEIDTAEKNIGLRTITLDRSDDEYGSNFCFVLNGVRLFIKGANLIPPDSFVTRFDEEKLAKMLDAVRFSNMNMLRIWGGGYYGSDSLYDMCDKKGILIWQDFMFACQAYPFFMDDFRQNVLEEIECNVKRITCHPSLALWCGNNEIESMSGAWLYMKKYIEWTEKFFWDILPNKVSRFDNVTPFIAGTPVGDAHNKNVGSDDIGDTHLWEVWHGLLPMKYYRKRPTRFCSEYGFESLPDIKAIEKFATPSDYDLNSTVFTAHQKCLSGNMRMVYYIADRFRLPKKFEDFIYLSQVAQSECVGDAAEFWRRNKGRCNGAIYWQLNDCWGTCSWASMDYYGNYKALQYTSRHFFAPLEVSFDDEVKTLAVKVINDTRFSRDLRLSVRVFDFETGIINESISGVMLNGVSSSVSYEMPQMLYNSIDKAHTGIVAELIENNKVINRKTYYFKYEKHLALPKAKISSEVTENNGNIIIRISSNVLARLVYVQNKSSNHFSDNFFDVLPGETVTITQPVDDSMTFDEQKNSLAFISATDIEADKSPINDYFKRLSVLLKPINFIPYLYDKYKKH